MLTEDMEFITKKVETVYYAYSLITDSVLEIFDSLEEAQLYSARSKEPCKVKTLALTRYIQNKGGSNE